MKRTSLVLLPNFLRAKPCFCHFLNPAFNIFLRKQLFSASSFEKQNYVLIVTMSSTCFLWPKSHITFASKFLFEGVDVMTQDKHTQAWAVVVA